MQTEMMGKVLKGEISDVDLMEEITQNYEYLIHAAVNHFQSWINFAKFN